MAHSLNLCLHIPSVILAWEIWSVGCTLDALPRKEYRILESKVEDRKIIWDRVWCIVSFWALWSNFYEGILLSCTFWSEWFFCSSILFLVSCYTGGLVVHLFSHVAFEYLFLPPPIFRLAIRRSLSLFEVFANVSYSILSLEGCQICWELISLNTSNIFCQYLFVQWLDFCINYYLHYLSLYSWFPYIF